MTDSDTISTYQSVAEEYRERHADRSGVRELVEQFLDALDAATDRKSPRVADVGCGPGWESATFADAGHEVVGADLTPAFLRAANDRAPDAEFTRMDMRSLGFVTDSFDGLWACASFLHVPREDAPATLREFRRVLRPGGVLLVSVARGDGETVGDTYDEDERRFTLYGTTSYGGSPTTRGSKSSRCPTATGFNCSGARDRAETGVGSERLTRRPSTRAPTGPASRRF